MDLAWITDIHFDHLFEERILQFTRSLRGEMEDAPGVLWQGILCTGDISCAEVPNFSQFDLQKSLRALVQESGLPLYYVLGNHDYYRTSIKHLRETLPTWQIPGAHYLSILDPISLTERTVLTGCDGWSDGLASNFMMSSLVLNDYEYIEELRLPTRLQLSFALREQGKVEAEVARGNLRKALSLNPSKILFLIHPPPFWKACWHEGSLSDHHWSPHFVCVQVGEVLMEAALDNPMVDFLVLCGHTHSPGEYQPLENLKVLTGGAIYGSPAIAKVLEIP